MSKSLNTVNVIDIANRENTNIRAFVAFPDDPDGNAEAEKLFCSWIRSINPDVTGDEMEDCLDEGCFEVGEGVIILAHTFGE